MMSLGPQVEPEAVNLARGMWIRDPNPQGNPDPLGIPQLRNVQDRLPIGPPGTVGSFYMPGGIFLALHGSMESQIGDWSRQC